MTLELPFSISKLLLHCIIYKVMHLSFEKDSQGVFSHKQTVGFTFVPGQRAWHDKVQNRSNSGQHFNLENLPKFFFSLSKQISGSFTELRKKYNSYVMLKSRDSIEFRWVCKVCLINSEALILISSAFAFCLSLSSLTQHIKQLP